MAFLHRDIDLSDAYEKALADHVGSPDAIVLATMTYSSSSTEQRGFLLAVPSVDEPMLVGAAVWKGMGDQPYLRVKELAPVSVMTRRRLPAELQRPLELHRADDASIAGAAGGDHASKLWYDGLGREAACLVRSVSPGSTDPVTISFVGQWMEGDQYVSEVLSSASATELRELIEAEFSVALAR
jgi:hypothetical protein